MTRQLLHLNFARLPVNLGLLAAAICAAHVAICLPRAFASQTITAQSHGEPSSAPIQVKLENLPLSFEANEGQTDPQVKFISRGGGYTLFLMPTEALISIQHEDDGNANSGSRSTPTPPSQRARAAGRAGKIFKTAFVRMRFQGATQEPKLAGLAQMRGQTNYLVGNDPKGWHTGIRSYAQVKYLGLYRGIDAVYHGRGRQLECDFVVSAGARPDAIDIGFEGADKLAIDENGNLVLNTGAGELIQSAPQIYQQVAGKRRTVRGGYVLRGKDRVGFRVASYDRGRPLIIDPSLSLSSTYLGGGNDDHGYAIAVDSSGNAYITGTANATFPTTPGAFQGPGVYPNGYTDAFVSKLSADASTLLYSTYLGGNQGAAAFGITVDSSGNAYITGRTTSTNFPVTAGALQTTFGGCVDAFVSELNSAGSGLIFSTYLGGARDDEGARIARDSSGAVYVTGFTSDGGGVCPGGFPTTAGAFRTNIVGDEDTFVAKLNGAGTALVYSTLLGGSTGPCALDPRCAGCDAEVEAYGIAVDSSGDAYITGYTDTKDFPTTAGAFRTNNVFTCQQGFVTKFNSNASALVYSTYLGGTNNTDLTAIALDSSHNAFVTGYTDSIDYPVTSGAFQTTRNGDYNAVITKLNPTGSSLIYSTYMGGSGNVTDAGDGIAVDSSGIVYVTGSTTSLNFPVTVGAFQTRNGSNSPCPYNSSASCTTDVFFLELNPNLTGSAALLYSTYLGGTDNDIGYSIALSNGNAYITGETKSSNFPTSATAYRTTDPGGYNAFMARFAPKRHGG